MQIINNTNQTKLGIEELYKCIDYAIDKTFEKVKSKMSSYLTTNMLITRAIEILEECDKDETRIADLQSGDPEKIKKVFQGCIDGFFTDLEGGYDCCAHVAEHFYHTALDIIARLYLDMPIKYDL